LGLQAYHLFSLKIYLRRLLGTTTLVCHTTPALLELRIHICATIGRARLPLIRLMLLILLLLLLRWGWLPLGDVSCLELRDLLMVIATLLLLRCAHCFAYYR
jgi:hypothetical protein